MALSVGDITEFKDKSTWIVVGLKAPEHSRKGDDTAFHYYPSFAYRYNYRACGGPALLNRLIGWGDAIWL